MIIYENRCVDCNTSYACTHCSDHVRSVVCDECESDEEILFDYDGGTYCTECLLEVLAESGIIERNRDA